MTPNTQAGPAEVGAGGGVAMPSAVVRGLTFFPVPEFSDPEIAFGAQEGSFFNRRDLPDVPRKYRDAAMGLFYSGGKLPAFDPRIDPTLAARATKAWLGSWAPAHESKEATVGYAFWLWSTPEAIDAAIAKAVQP